MKGAPGKEIYHLPYHSTWTLENTGPHSSRCELPCQSLRDINAAASQATANATMNQVFFHKPRVGDAVSIQENELGT